MEERAEEDDEEEGGSASDEGGYWGAKTDGGGGWQRSGYPVWALCEAADLQRSDLRFSCAAEKLAAIEQKRKFDKSGQSQSRNSRGHR